MLQCNVLVTVGLRLEDVAMCHSMIRTGGNGPQLIELALLFDTKVNGILSLHHIIRVLGNRISNLNVSTEYISSMYLISLYLHPPMVVFFYGTNFGWMWGDVMCFHGSIGAF